MARETHSVKPDYHEDNVWDENDKNKGNDDDDVWTPQQEHLNMGKEDAWSPPAKEVVEKSNQLTSSLVARHPVTIMAIVFEFSLAWTSRPPGESHNVCK